MTKHAEYSGGAIVEFLDYTSTNGLMNKSTAGSLSSAVRKVVDVTHPDASWEAVDLKNADLDDIAQRFETLARTEYKPDSLNVYKSRFKNAIKMYGEWLQNPSGWRYKAERPAAQRNKATSKKETSETSSPDEKVPDRLPPAPPGMITYPYPLRPDMIVQLSLPPDLRGTEARRLAAFVESLVAEEQLALSAASE